MVSPKKATPHAPATGGSSMPDNHVFPNGGVNECYGALNGYRLLEAAEDSLAEKIEDKGVAACPASLLADLLILNQLEQIGENTAKLACFGESLETEVTRRQDETNALLRELTDAVRALARA